MNKKFVLTISLCSLFVISVVLMALSKVAPVLLVVALALMLVFLLALTYLTIQSYLKTNKETKNKELEKIMESQQDSLFDDVQINETKRRPERNNSKVAYIAILVIAVIVCAYMFIRLIV